MQKFYKYQALGNDYIVLPPGEVQVPPSLGQIRWLCDRHYGIGADGILFGPLPTDSADVAVRIFNPDGSEAEKSGNGLRIFTQFLWEWGSPQLRKLFLSSSEDKEPISPVNIETKGGVVQAQILSESGEIKIQMGRLSFKSTDIPVSGPERDVVNEQIRILGEDLRYCAATIGNPHCIILCKHTTPELACLYGPLVENDARFPNRTNVQFVEVLDTHTIKIEIWERGAGYTLASGSSSCAAAAASVRLGMCTSPITVEMQGGRLQIEIDTGYCVSMQGAVQYVFQGECEAPNC